MHLLKQIEISMLGAAMYVMAGCAMAEVVVVVSPSSPVTSMSSSDVADIFLGKTKRFPNGERAVPLDMAESSAERNEFYLRYTGKSLAQMKAYWSKLIFTGKGLPPREVQQGQEVSRMISGNANLIGYMDRSMVDSNVRVVTITE